LSRSVSLSLYFCDLPSSPTRRSSDLLLYSVAGVTIAVALGFAAVDRFLLSAAVCFAGLLPTGLLTFALRGRSPRYEGVERLQRRDRKSTRLNSSHVSISYAVFCLRQK